MLPNELKIAKLDIRLALFQPIGPAFGVMHTVMESSVIRLRLHAEEILIAGKFIAACAGEVLRDVGLQVCPGRWGRHRQDIQDELCDMAIVNRCV